MADDNSTKFDFDQVNFQRSVTDLLEDPVFDKIEKKTEMTFVPKNYNAALPSIEEIERVATEQIKNFASLLSSASVDEKLKMLWLQTYTNAVNDRKTAHCVFVDLYSIVIGDEAKYAIQGDRLSKYMERMEKSNAQLLKLSEIVSEYAFDEGDDVPTGQSLFEALEKGKKV